MTITVTADQKRLIAGYQLCASTEGKTQDAIDIVVTSVKRFIRFLSTLQGGMPLTGVTRQEIREFISTCNSRRVYPSIPLTKPRIKASRDIQSTAISAA